MKIHLKLGTLVVFAFTAVMLAVIAYVFAPLWLMNSRAYSAFASVFALSPYSPQVLLQAAQNMDPTPGPNFAYIFPGNDMASSGSPVPQAKAKQAKEYLDILITNYPNSTYAQTARSLRVQINEQLGNWAGAIQELRQEVAFSPGLSRSDAVVQLKRLTETQSAKQDPQVMGRVTAEGAPIPYAYVFLRPIGESNVFQTDAVSQYIGAFSDSHGVYRISGVAPGRYQVCVGVKTQQVAGFFLPLPQNESIVAAQGKVTTYNLPFVSRVGLTDPTGGVTVSGPSLRFSWKPYPHAAYYKLSITDYINLSATDFDSVSVPLKGRYEGTHATFSVSSLRDILPGVAYDSPGGSKSASTLAPASALGLVYPGGEFSWDVNAYDANGKLLSSSHSVYIGLPDKTVPVFHLSTSGQLQGERLLLQHQQAAAIRAFQSEIPNPYALRALAVLALYGHGMNSTSREGAAQALAYLNQIPNRTPTILQLVKDAKRQLANTQTSGSG